MELAVTPGPISELVKFVLSSFGLANQSLAQTFGVEVGCGSAKDPANPEERKRDQWNSVVKKFYHGYNVGHGWQCPPARA